MENGKADRITKPEVKMTTLTTLISLLRALRALDTLNDFLPYPGISQIAMTSMLREEPRKYASKPRKTPPATPWKWGIKAIIAWNPRTGEIRSGQLPSSSGFEPKLLKFDGVAANRDKESDDPLGYNTTRAWTRRHQMTLNGIREDFSVAGLLTAATAANLKPPKAKSTLKQVHQAIA